MKIYFAGSISGGRADVDFYKELIEYLKDFGQVLTEFIGNDALLATGEAGISDKQIHDRDLEWLMEADVLVAEVSTPSFGVGYEIGRSVENNKNILCLHKEKEGKRLSAMIAGCDSIKTEKYKKLEDAKAIINRFFKSL
ncbi:MAG: nucleoside 2-deoxyribosyltransferase [Bacteroidetes bacterium]|nr:MAG: nucleoside 2-deoxyribosyltransferase [Bacteroidota bacterium]RLD84881.1 MAG: nucleoside 2-deoxyribosyltransferase [Bacteroidota bacterium]